MSELNLNEHTYRRTIVTYSDGSTFPGHLHRSYDPVPLIINTCPKSGGLVQYTPDGVVANRRDGELDIIAVEREADVDLSVFLDRSVTYMRRDGVKKSCFIVKTGWGNDTYGTKVSSWLTDGVYHQNGRNLGCEGGSSWDMMSIEEGGEVSFSEQQQNLLLRDTLNQASRSKSREK